MNNTNRLVSGDNKGAASLFMEGWGRGREGFAEDFVAAFAQVRWVPWEAECGWEWGWHQWQCRCGWLPLSVSCPV